MADQLPFSHHSIRQEMHRLLASREFSRAEYLCRFLRCCVEQTLRGNASQLKEFWLGRSVFQRDKTFDPSTDPIVRVQARRLRQKLDRYYAQDAGVAGIRIALPVGTYVPAFLPGSDDKQPSSPGTKPQSLAILPFANLERDSSSTSFAALLTDELVHNIMQTGKFLVVSQLSSSRFKDAADVREIGRALNADLLIEGHIRGYETGRAVSVQLTDAASGYHVWSAWFHCSDRSTAREGADIARRIAGMLNTGPDSHGKLERVHAAAANFS